jgi:hypothetical protein
MAIKTPNLLMEEEFILMFQVEGIRICTTPINSTKGPNRSTNHNAQTF